MLRIAPSANVSGSNWESELSPRLAAQTAPSPTATAPPRDSPVRIPATLGSVVASENCGSTRVRSPRSPLAIQTAPAPTAIPVGVSSRRGTVRTITRVRASSCDAVLSSTFATQTDEPPTATALGREPTGYLADNLVRLRVDQPDRVRFDGDGAASRGGENDDGGHDRGQGKCAEREEEGTPARAGGGLRRARRWKLRRELRRRHLVEPYGPVEILQLPHAEVAQEDVQVLLLVLDQGLGRLRHEHLPPVPRRADPGRPVNGEAGIAAVAGGRLPGVDPQDRKSVV